MPRQHLLFDMEAAAKQAGAIVNSVMLGAIAGSGPPADPGRGVRGRDQGATARRSRAICAVSAPGLAAARDQLPVPLARSPKRPAKPTLADLEAEAAAFPRSRARVRHRRRAPARAYQNLDYARLYLQRLEAGRRGRRARQRRRQAARRDRAPPRGAHVVRGCDPRRRGEDRAGSLPPHRGRDRRQGSALRHHGIPQARHRGAVPGAAAAPRARDRGVFREARLARQGLFRHGAEDHDRVGLSRASGRWRSSSASVRRAGASPRSRP